MKQADGDAPGARLGHLCRHPPEVGDVRLDEHLPPGIDALSDLERQTMGHRGHRGTEEQIEAILLLPGLTPEAQHVTEAFRRHEGDVAAFALQDHVSGERRPVYDTTHPARPDPLGTKDLCNSCGHSLTGVVRCGRDLDRRHVPIGVADDYVGKRAPDVHAEEVADGRGLLHRVR